MTRLSSRGASDVATKLDPKLWEASKRRACSRAKLCRHSARKMQWAVRDYKARGGRYDDAASSKAHNSLSRWTRQRWRTHSGKPSRGVRRYLPAEAWNHLSPSQIRRTNATKRAGFAEGRQWVPQPRDVATVARRFRRDTPGRRSR